MDNSQAACGDQGADFTPPRPTQQRVHTISQIIGGMLDDCREANLSSNGAIPYLRQETDPQDIKKLYRFCLLLGAYAQAKAQHRNPDRAIAPFIDRAALRQAEAETWKAT